MTEDITLLVAFTAGVLSFLSPCVLPLIPSYLSFISGVSLEEIKEDAPGKHIRARVLGNSLAFVLGFSLVFVSLGASASFLGSLFFSYRSLIQTIGGVLILLVGIYLLGIFKISVLERYLQFNLKNKPAGYLGSGLVGVTFAVAWTPCVGPILGAILALAATASGINRGMLLLSAYAAGLAVPFFLSGLALNQFFEFFRVIRRHINTLHVCAGVLLVFVGILLLTDSMTYLNAFALQFTPDWLIKRL